MSCGTVHFFRGTSIESERLQGVVFWTGLDRDAVVIVRQSERIKDSSKEAEGRPKGVVEPRERGTDKVSKSDTQ